MYFHHPHISLTSHLPLDNEDHIHDLDTFLFDLKHLHIKHLSLSVYKECRRLNPSLHTLLHTLAPSLLSLSIHALEKYCRNRRGEAGPCTMAWMPVLPYLTKLTLGLCHPIDPGPIGPQGWSLHHHTPNLIELDIGIVPLQQQQQQALQLHDTVFSIFQRHTQLQAPPSLRRLQLTNVFVSTELLLRSAWVEQPKIEYLCVQFQPRQGEDDVRPCQYYKDELPLLAPTLVHLKIDMRRVVWADHEGMLLAVAKLTGLTSLQLIGGANFNDSHGDAAVRPWQVLLQMRYLRRLQIDQHEVSVNSPRYWVHRYIAKALSARHYPLLEDFEMKICGKRHILLQNQSNSARESGVVNKVLTITLAQLAVHARYYHWILPHDSGYPDDDRIRHREEVREIRILIDQKCRERDAAVVDGCEGDVGFAIGEFLEQPTLRSKGDLYVHLVIIMQLDGSNKAELRIVDRLYYRLMGLPAINILQKYVSVTVSHQPPF